MAYNIMKTMYDSRGKKQHVLLNNGLSEILTYEDVNEAMTMVTILNDNADSRTEYEIRPTHSVSKRRLNKETDISSEARKKHMDESDIAYNRGIWPHKITSDDEYTQRMIDLMNNNKAADEDSSD